MQIASAILGTPPGFIVLLLLLPIIAYVGWSNWPAARNPALDGNERLAAWRRYALPGAAAVVLMLQVV